MKTLSRTIDKIKRKRVLEDQDGNECSAADSYFDRQERAPVKQYKAQVRITAAMRARGARPRRVSGQHRASRARRTRTASSGGASASAGSGSSEGGSDGPGEPPAAASQAVALLQNLFPGQLYLTIPQAAGAIARSEKSLRNRISNGTLPFPSTILLGRRVVLLQDLADFISSLTPALPKLRVVREAGAGPRVGRPRSVGGVL